MKEKKRIPTDGAAVPWKSPFAVLKDVVVADPAPGSSQSVSPPSSEERGTKSRGRVEIQRQTAHRGGKTVTVVSGFVGIGQDEKERLAKEMQKACGAGGTVKEGRIEIQGDQRETVARLLTKAGFRPVFTGG
ncbi:MAG: translation initiation factor [Nitrospiraceae bacterium]|nr:translation initiation factor [Nitrospiraceae bacterium]